MRPRGADRMGGGLGPSSGETEIEVGGLVGQAAGERPLPCGERLTQALQREQSLARLIRLRLRWKGVGPSR